MCSSELRSARLPKGLGSGQAGPVDLLLTRSTRLNGRGLGDLPPSPACPRGKQRLRDVETPASGGFLCSRLCAKRLT